MGVKHVPGTALRGRGIGRRRGIIGAAELAKCKDGVRIVNAARDGLIDEKALYAFISMRS